MTAALSLVRTYPRSAQIVTAASLPFYGYNDPALGAIGSIKQSCFPPVNAIGFGILPCKIYTIGSRAGTYDLTLYMSQAWAANHFNKLRIVDSAGVMRTYLSSAASVSFGFPGEITWTWGAGADPVWTTAGQRRLVTLE